MEGQAFEFTYVFFIVHDYGLWTADLTGGITRFVLSCKKP